MPITDIGFKVENVLKKRQQDSHKGLFGNVVVVGGDYGMPGAVRIAAEAALRVGAGLVTVITRKEHVAPVVCGRPELLCYGLDESDPTVDSVLARASVLLLGSGLGQSSWSKFLYNKVIDLPIPKIIDADALNLLALETISRKSTNWILTPHPGEASRLLGVAIKDVQREREKSIKSLHTKYGGIIVLKGHGTLITKDGLNLKRCNAGNPGMASAGMGDLLAGIIAGLLAQGVDLISAAEVGVMRHALAGDRAILRSTRPSVLACDLLLDI